MEVLAVFASRSSHLPEEIGEEMRACVITAHQFYTGEKHVHQSMFLFRELISLLCFIFRTLLGDSVLLRMIKFFVDKVESLTRRPGLKRTRLYS